MADAPVTGLPDLTGTVTLVTGAGGNIGAGIARRFAAAGSAVVAHYWSSADRARRLATGIRAEGGRASWEQADLRDPVAVDRLLEAVVGTFGRIDVLVNNAGVQPVEPLPEMDFDRWREVVAANAHSTFLATRAAARHMIEQGDGGSVISIASIEAVHPAVGHAHYSAAKAAVRIHARAAAVEYGPHGIRVNSVSPGLVTREGIERDWPEGVRRWRASAPLTRLGTPEDVGNACVFLASPLASWITGHDLVVDGGVSAGSAW
ncbi:3-oxoacyl-[acyl-carrier protein] reductase [Streptoalloteichus tenebrarius]|uniref:3-oxoacyl-[acyl-carrier protein] reductase n=1 Tax=Streptoalloteichus tenebrarius (strain ATCC 17920 / DSM 40477 / JCM 4838 / CBS 697.72 / NBRC 16177 / NCIMB 11028 / NRRL B-12390 / A12253. 1 / ISP 5477) TaxID=1933 RepID=A0ABT1HQL4_STRSD|nr:SDR family NAD(P)-dependent oxidoreductase [Streptoalloteichus tenebrarius]MCP2257805.1 3-oxoacyl-[acyl-carrier protein] reductase [Streptoalloteichus tenebrarius]BFE99831.1 SDR family NAD(P)-dependent oxidoreductase [Streptoalloteichus tenebrarius]